MTDLSNADARIAELWVDEIEPQLTDYIAIPALSPAFDADWHANGHLAAAVEQIRTWLAARPIAGLVVEVHELDGRTPVILAEIPAFGDAASSAVEDGPTVLLYGHLDKQPEMTGWRDGLGPWTPVRDGDRLYGRGGADDGYAAFASLAAIEAVQAAGGSHPRCVLLVEASEESGSPDLPAHVAALSDRLGEVALVVCLDSGCATYDTLWLTTSLRGLVGGTLRVDIVTEGLHSGAAGGVVPSTFRIARHLLDRIEDAATGAVLVAAAQVDIPAGRRTEAAAVAEELGDGVLERVPLVPGARVVADTPAEALLDKTWRPSLSVIGADGLPPTATAGNVLRPTTCLALSLRIPPGADPEAVRDELAATLESDPPYGARVRFEPEEAAAGWNAPELAPWLAVALDGASQEVFDRPVRLYGEGGTIPFMAMLGEAFPAAQFVITGVLGPESNAHGPNEFLDVAYAEKLTGVLARVLEASTAGLTGGR